jgi:NADPH:quinone reductase-like Zn-dependent oxidoreductase
MPSPQPASGEVLIRVHAAGVTPTELGWYPTTHTKDGSPRRAAVPGHEFSGVVVALGPATQGFQVDDEIYGMNDWFADGATADYCIALAQQIAPKPRSLSHEEAAAVPISALTAWQGLITRARIAAGHRLLIHGAAGAVGLYAVQLARMHGAHIIATASGADTAFLEGLGVEQVIDYRTARFEDHVRDLDFIFDTVGGDTLARSWNLLKPQGRMITIAADAETSSDPRLKDAFFIVEPDQQQLIEVGRLIDRGQLQAFLKAPVAFDRAPLAYSGQIATDTHGKLVVSVA